MSRASQNAAPCPSSRAMAAFFKRQPGGGRWMPAQEFMPSARRATTDDQDHLRSGSFRSGSCRLNPSDLGSSPVSVESCIHGNADTC
jgi:hypothetical protein